MDNRKGQRIHVRSLLGFAFLIGMVLLLAGCQSSTPSAASAGSGGASGGLQVEVVYLNHPPVRPIVQQIDQVLAGYGDKVFVTKYDFDTPEGAAFAKKKGLSGHIPLAIFIDGSETFDLGGRNVKFESFPQGEGTGMVADGAWTMTDFQSALDSKITK
jgi:hypothetical protein